mmetsp:Transcript_49784/g.128088  ORF Transcript_49784/g.128088 Transcript_49784/m.128088 type:complete len:230 (-) Transcript_49784:691-1380(-)
MTALCIAAMRVSPLLLRTCITVLFCAFILLSPPSLSPLHTTSFLSSPLLSLPLLFPLFLSLLSLLLPSPSSAPSSTAYIASISAISDWVRRTFSTSSSFSSVKLSYRCTAPPHSPSPLTSIATAFCSSSSHCSSTCATTSLVTTRLADSCTRSSLRRRFRLSTLLPSSLALSTSVRPSLSSPSSLPTSPFTSATILRTASSLSFLLLYAGGSVTLTFELGRAEAGSGGC